MLNLSRELLQNVMQQQVKQVVWHLQQLLETQIHSSPYAKDDALVDRIDPRKDVDGFQAVNVGRLALPEEHMPQCQQVLMVTGAEKLLFVVSDGTPDKFCVPLFMLESDVLGQRQPVARCRQIAI